LNDETADRQDLHSVGEVLRWARRRLSESELHFGHGTATADDEAAFLVLEGLGLPIDDLDAVLQRPLSESERQQLIDLVDQRIATRKPAAYLLGRAYIGGHPFRADERALVPRSFIGELLAAGIDSGTPLPFITGEPRAILDLGAGSGSLAILAALAFPEASVDAVDISADALALAADNVADYGLGDRVRLLEGDLYGPVAGRRYDLIVSNPPYVDAEAMAALPAEYRAEPALGLAGGEDGLDLVRRIVLGAGDHLHDGGSLLCEIGAGQERLVASFPDVPFLWLSTETSEGEVFWLDAADARRLQKP
jgi:ribosomal protein L3 glutamine methyltransferase